MDCRRFREWLKHLLRWKTSADRSKMTAGPESEGDAVLEDGDLAVAAGFVAGFDFA